MLLQAGRLAHVLLIGAITTIALPTSTFAVAATKDTPKASRGSEKKVSAGARSSGPGQDALILSLADAVFIGLRKNTAIRSAFADRAAQKFDLKVAEDVFSPHATLSVGAVEQQTAGVTTRNVNVSPTVEWVTPIGTVFNFTWDHDATSAAGTQSRSSIATVGFNQPLLRGAGLDVNMAPVRSARIVEDLNQLHLRSTISDMVTTIIAAYRTLLRAQEAKILADNAITRAQALVDVDQELIRTGRMAQVEIVQAQADLENQRLDALQVEGQIDASRFSLAALLDLDLGAPLVAREKLEPTRTSLEVKQALDIAFARRPDYLAQNFVVEQAKLGIVVANNGLLWDLSLFGTGRFGRETGQASLLPIRTKVADGSMGLQLTVPLNDLQREQTALHASTSLADAEIGLRAVRQGVEQQIRTSVSGIDLSWRQLEVAHRARTLASSAVDIEKQKLNVGRSTNFQVQTLEANFRSSESQQLNATIDYLNALSALDQQLGTTLDTWKIGLSRP